MMARQVQFHLAPRTAVNLAAVRGPEPSLALQPTQGWHVEVRFGPDLAGMGDSKAKKDAK